MKTNLRVLAKTERGRKNKKRTGDNHRLAQERKTLLGKNKAAGKSLTREQEKLRRQTENQVKTRSALCTHEKEKSSSNKVVKSNSTHEIEKANFSL
jgi:hypothetical protein